MTTPYGDLDKKYSLIKKIGSGGTSKVFLGQSLEDPSKLFAVKILKPGSNSESKVFYNEVSVLKKIKHKNVVCLIDGGEGVLTKDSGKKYVVQYLVLELIKYGELFDYIFFPQKGFGEEIGKYIFHQLISGLEACHKAGIVHRDMKTENIMLGENWEMKIADFGFSTKSEGKKGNGLLYTALGTASYASPELLQKKPYQGIPSDIFSLGVSAFVLVTGKMPFKHALVDDPYYKEVVNKNYSQYWGKLESKVPATSKEFKEIFTKLIAYDPNSRPSLEELKNDPWLKGFNPDMNKINNEFAARTKLVQQKKELERKKEEEEEKERQKQRNFKQYKGEGVEVQDTSNDLDIKELDEEPENPFTLFYPKEENPGELLDYLHDIFSVNSKVIKMKKVDDSYKMAVGCSSGEDPLQDILVGNNVLLDNVEALMEIKRLKEGLVVEFSREVGSKYDFYSLFQEINNCIEANKNK